MSHVWPEVSRDRPAYTALPTDYWPWPEVLADLAARPNLSGALELSQGEARARALWADGEFLGAHDARTDHDLGGAMLALPRASVSLLLLDPVVARLAWRCRDVDPVPAGQDWTGLRSALEERAFSGVVRALGGDSFWQQGVRVSGPEPLATERVSLLTPGVRDVSPEEIVRFYGAVLGAASRLFAVESVWRASALELADDHPCLDPFAREVIYENGQLSLGTRVPTDELLPALRDATRLTLRRAGHRPSNLALDALRGEPLWSVSGLGEG